MKVRTWADLAGKIAAMSPEQRNQPIQCVKPTPIEDDVQEMLQGIAIATVEEFGFHKCRSTHNNKYNGSDVVLLMAGNPFSVDGVVAYELGDEINTPIYSKDGPTSPESQCSPQAKGDRKPTGGLPPHILEKVRSMTDFNIPPA